MQNSREHHLSAAIPTRIDFSMIGLPVVFASLNHRLFALLPLRDQFSRSITRLLISLQSTKRLFPLTPFERRNEEFGDEGLSMRNSIKSLLIR